MTVYFTSDLHFGHRNIMAHCPQRGPALNVEADDLDGMNQRIIELHNEVVSAGDDVWILGDLSMHKKADYMRPLLQAMNGNIHVIMGNHDERKAMKVLFEDGTIQSYQQDKMLKVNRTDGTEGKAWKFWLYHYPIVSWPWMNKGVIHLHGHCHGRLQLDLGKGFDVGIDAPDITADYRPVSAQEVVEHASTIDFKAYDHHD